MNSIEKSLNKNDFVPNDFVQLKKRCSITYAIKNNN